MSNLKLLGNLVERLSEKNYHSHEHMTDGGTRSILRSTWEGTDESRVIKFNREKISTLTGNLNASKGYLTANEKKSCED